MMPLPDAILSALPGGVVLPSPSRGTVARLCRPNPDRKPFLRPWRGGPDPGILDALLPLYCPVCGAVAELTTGRVVYPHRPDLAAKEIWRCPAGCAHVGCHPGTTIPLGTLADAPLRAARGRAHAAFDALWRRKMARDRCSKSAARTAAYRWLAAQLGIAVPACHIGSFDAATCGRVEAACAPYRRGADAPGDP